MFPLFDSKHRFFITLKLSKTDIMCTFTCEIATFLLFHDIFCIFYLVVGNIICNFAMSKTKNVDKTKKQNQLNQQKSLQPKRLIKQHIKPNQ